MDRFLWKRPLLLVAAGTLRSLRFRQDHTHVRSVSTTIPTEINLDDLPPDPADPKRISQYTKNPKK